jgi:2-dehydro-3-deoxyphosphooctonate aldolase (KDO 8-P synthase)
MTASFQIGHLQVGLNEPLFVIVGPCVIESRDLCLQIAEALLDIQQRTGVGVVFKASFDKANRSSISSFRGAGLQAGLDTLARIKDEFGCLLITDVHQPEQCAEVAKVVDILQIPAFLCRQTDLLVAAAECGKPVNVKKGQFLAPEDMAEVIKKIESSGNQRILLTERGASFGYHNLVVDMRSLVIMKQLGCPIIFDATHAVQIPGGLGNASGGKREFVFPLARAAAAVGIDGLFLETHPEPEKALSDGPNSVPLNQIPQILKTIKEINALVEDCKQN